MVRNKIVQDLGNKMIIVDNKYRILETSPLCPEPLPEPNVSQSKFENVAAKQEGAVREAVENDDPTLKIQIGPDVPQKS